MNFDIQFNRSSEEAYNQPVTNETFRPGLYTTYTAAFPMYPRTPLIISI